MPAFLEIHPIARSIVDSQFRNPLANWRDITRVSCGQSLYSGLNAGSALNVTQVIKPLNEDFGLANLDHEGTVSAWLHHVKPTAMR